MDIEVVHVKDYGKQSKNLSDNGLYVYCGRPSKLSNPFVMEDESQRNRVIEQFEQSMPREDINELEVYCKEHDIKSLKLGCYCAPKKCHCDAIKAFMEKNKQPVVFKFKELNFGDGFHMIARLLEDAPDVETGRCAVLVSSKNNEEKQATIREVIHINFAQLKTRYSPYLEKHHNEQCRDYQGLLSVMNGYYKRNIEKSKIVLIFFKVNKD